MRFTNTGTRYFVPGRREYLLQPLLFVEIDPGSEYDVHLDVRQGSQDLFQKVASQLARDSREEHRAVRVPLAQRHSR